MSRKKEIDGTEKPEKNLRLLLIIADIQSV